MQRGYDASSDCATTQPLALTRKKIVKLLNCSMKATDRAGHGLRIPSALLQTAPVSSTTLGWSRRKSSLFEEVGHLCHNDSFQRPSHRFFFFQNHDEGSGPVLCATVPSPSHVLRDYSIPYRSREFSGHGYRRCRHVTIKFSSAVL